MIGTIDPGAGPVGVSLGGFLDFSGNLDVTSATVGVTAVSNSNPGGTQVSGVKLYTFGAPAGTSVFIGADGGTPAATGLQGVSTGDVIGALFVDSATGRVWTAASGTLDAAIVGVSGLTLSASGLSATLNSTASDGTWLDLTKLDLGGGAGYNSTLSIPTGAGVDALALTTASASASAAEARVAIGDNVLAQGAFSVIERTVDVDTVAGGAIEDPGASLLDATISGASLFFGAGASFDTAGNTIDTANAVGFSATGPRTPSSPSSSRGRQRRATRRATSASRRPSPTCRSRASWAWTSRTRRSRSTWRATRRALPRPIASTGRRRCSRTRGRSRRSR